MTRLEQEVFEKVLSKISLIEALEAMQDGFKDRHDLANAEFLEEIMKDSELLGHNFSVWMEGFKDEKVVHHAKHLGIFKAGTFKKACEQALEIKGYDKSEFDCKELTFDGRHMYSDEYAARKLLG